MQLPMTDMGPGFDGGLLSYLGFAHEKKQRITNVNMWLYMYI